MNDKKSQLSSGDRIAAQVDKWSKTIPSRYLREICKTRAQIQYWEIQRNEAELLCTNLKAVFGGGGGSPVLKAYKAKQISEFEYRRISALTNLFLSAWVVIQGGWEYIYPHFVELYKSHNQDISDIPTSDILFFKETLNDWFDSKILMTFGFSQLTLKQIEEKAKDMRAIGWSLPENTKYKMVTNRDSSIQSPDLLITAIGICCQAKDPVLDVRVQDLVVKLTETADLFAVETRRARKGKSKNIQSNRWVDGEFQTFTKSAWRTVSLEDSS